MIVTKQVKDVLKGYFYNFITLKGKQYGNNYKSIWIIEEIHLM